MSSPSSSSSSSDVTIDDAMDNAIQLALDIAIGIRDRLIEELESGESSGVLLPPIIPLSTSMAPTKRKNDEKLDTASENLKSTRATRSSTRLASQGVAKVVVEEAPKTKKAKVSSKEKPDAKAKPISKKKPEPKAKTTEEVAETADPPSNGVNGSKTIVIEHCKQCTQFKIRAVKVKAGLETAVSGINVLVNPEKPRRGCFEVREEGGKTFISLLDMKRPFAPMKALDMDVVISDIVDQIK